MVMGWAGLLLFIGSWVRALGGGMTGLGWAGLVCGFVGSWVALGFVWVSFRFSGGKSDRFATAKGRRGYAKRSERSSLVRGRSFVDFLQVHEGSGKWVTQ